MKNCLIRIPVFGQLRTALWATLGIACLASAPAMAQKDMGCSPTVANPCSGGSTSGSSTRRRSSPSYDYEAERRAKEAAEAAERRDAAHALNDQGREAYKKGDWAAAASYFQQALQNNPDSDVIRQNLAYARAKENEEREAAERRRQDKVAADNMQKSIQSFAQSLNAAPSSGGLDFDGGVSTTAAKAGSKSDGLDFTTNTDASVVDLRDAKTLTLDPSRVKGTFVPGSGSTPRTAESLESVIKSMSALAKTLGWSAEEQTRLARELNALDADGTPGTTVRQGYEAWANMQAREKDPALAREAAKVGGVGFPGAGKQSTNDCTIFALANAAGLPYSVAAARATKLISEAEWRDPAERANPESVFEKGLNGQEVIMLAEAFGQAQVVPSSAFAATLNNGRPILLAVVLTQKQESNKYSQGYHEVVLTKTFQHEGETWFEMMDSNQPATVRHYLTAKELGVIMFENGVAFRPDPRTTPKLFR